MGKIIDIYFKFGEVRDAYLERVLVGLDSTTEEIAMLLPYFIQGMENETIRSALHLTFSTVCNRYSNDISLLLLLIGSIIYHSDFLKGIISKNPGHVLGNMCILNNTDLLDKQKHLITVKLSDRMTPTGVPSHIHQLKLIRFIH